MLALTIPDVEAGDEREESGEEEEEECDGSESNEDNDRDTCDAPAGPYDDQQASIRPLLQAAIAASPAGIYHRAQSCMDFTRLLRPVDEQQEVIAALERALETAKARLSAAQSATGDQVRYCQLKSCHTPRH
jgi:hypothetical protein